MVAKFKKHTFISAAVLGFIILIPLTILELVNRAKFNEGFPFAVFNFTWLLQTLFIWILLPMTRKTFKKTPSNLLLRIAGLVVIAFIWGSWIIDQWPCLMGVPNCD